MRDDDDNVLADYDLSAWEAPPPSAGLADAVIARAKQPPAVAAVTIPKFDSKLGDSNLAPWVSIMKSQGMIRGDVSLKNIIVP